MLCSRPSAWISLREYKSEGCSILLVSHGLEAVQDLCDDAIWLDAGRLMALGPVSEVIRKYEQHLGHHTEALPNRAVIDSER